MSKANRDWLCQSLAHVARMLHWEFFRGGGESQVWSFSDFCDLEGIPSIAHLGKLQTFSVKQQEQRT
jgi:hypothetical protein